MVNLRERHVCPVRVADRDRLLIVICGQGTTAARAFSARSASISIAGQPDVALDAAAQHAALAARDGLAANDGPSQRQALAAAKSSLRRYVAPDATSHASGWSMRREPCRFFGPA